MNTERETTTPTPTTLNVPMTAGDVAKELNVSRTTVKQLAIETFLSVQKTPSGVWIFSPAAVEKIRSEIERRKREASR